MEESKIAIVEPQREEHSSSADKQTANESGDSQSTDAKKTRRTRDTWIISVFIIVSVVVFAVTMIVNDCPAKTKWGCSAPALGKLSFQPIHENPLLGPSLSTFDGMGAMRRSLLKERQFWRILSSPWLHAGIIHLLLDIICTILVGISLEKELGPLKIGTIYILSGICGTSVAALFIRDSPAVTSSGSLLGLLGAKLSSTLIRWETTSNKISTLMMISIVCLCNLLLGLLPNVDNYANVGGFMSGMLLGFAILLDKPTSCGVPVVVFLGILGGSVLATIMGVDVAGKCGWCAKFDCVETSKWRCNEVVESCEVMFSRFDMTLTCMTNGKFRVFPLPHVPTARVTELCTLLC